MNYNELKAIAKREARQLSENPADFEKLQLAFMKGFAFSEDIHDEAVNNKPAYEANA